MKKTQSALKFWPAWLALALLAVFCIWPLWQTLRGGFLDDAGHPTLIYLRAAFANPVYREGLYNSLLLACVATGLVIAIGLPLAWLNTYCKFPGQNILGILILAPLVLPPFVGAVGVRQIIGQYGALNALLVVCQLRTWENVTDWLAVGRFWATAITTALHLYPIFYLNVQAAMERVESAWLEAAENLGYGTRRKFFHITLPLIMPGVFAGAILAFIWAFTELGTPLMFDFNRIMAVQIYDGLSDIGATAQPYALVVIMLAVAGGLYFLARLLFGRQRQFNYQRPGPSAPPRTLPPLQGGLAAGFFALVFCAGTLPHCSVIAESFGRGWYRAVLPKAWTLQHYQQALSHELILSSLRNSLFYAGAATVLALVLGLIIAITLTRTSWRWRHLLDALAMLPLAVPGMVLAFGYLTLTQPGQWLEAFNPGRNPAILLIIAYAVRRLPYLLRAITAGLQQSPPELEEAAASLGCPGTMIRRRITLPIIRPHLTAGCILVFSFAMLEVSDSLMLAQRQIHYPLTKALYELTQILGEGRYLAAALGVWMMAFLFLTLLVAGRFLGRRLGQLFRF